MPDYLPKTLQSSSIPLLASHNVHHIYGLLQWMDRKLNTPLKITHPFLTNMRPPEFKPFPLMLYFSRDVDPKTLPVPNEISNQQSKPTGKTARTCEQLMDCLFTHPKAVIQYYASDMTLSLVSDVAYLVLPDARNEQNGIILQLRNHRSGHHGSECTCKW